MNNIAILSDYVVLAVLGICICVGYIIKHLIPGKAVNRFIPLIMALLGIVLNSWINTWNLSPEIVLGGLISGLASTGMYEAFKNTIIKHK